MSLSKEARIGLLVTISLVIFFIGFYFLKGADIFSNEREYYCYYNNVDGLLNSANVQIKGLNVGHVAHMQLENGKGVRVSIMVDKSIALPEGSVASLQSLDLLGTKIITIAPSNGPGILPKGAELVTEKQGGIVDNVTAELTPRLQEMKGTIVELDTALAGINDVVGEENQKVITAALKSIKATADNMAALSAALGNESGEISSILHNLNSITTNLAKNNDTVKMIMANVNNVTRQLSNAPIQQTFASLQSVSAQLHDVMTKINNGEGSLGKMVNDKALYDNLTKSLHSLDSLMGDVNAHPHRYINVAIFGGKKKD